MTPLVQLLLPLALATLLLVTFHQPAPVTSATQQMVSPNPEVLAEQIPEALYSSGSSNQLGHL